MSVVKEDDKWIYIQAGGYFARPGPVTGYDHALEMGDLGLKKGDKVKARHSGTFPELNVITLPDGRKTYWKHSGDIISGRK